MLAAIEDAVAVHRDGSVYTQRLGLNSNKMEDLPTDSQSESGKHGTFKFGLILRPLTQRESGCVLAFSVTLTSFYSDICNFTQPLQLVGMMEQDHTGEDNCQGRQASLSSSKLW